VQRNLPGQGLEPSSEFSKLHPLRECLREIFPASFASKKESDAILTVVKSGGDGADDAPSSSSLRHLPETQTQRTFNRDSRTADAYQINFALN